MITQRTSRSALTAALAATLMVAAACSAAEEARRMSVEDLKKRLDAGEKVVIVDSRGTASAPVIKDAIHVPNDRLAEWAKDKPKDALIVTYCA